MCVCVCVCVGGGENGNGVGRREVHSKCLTNQTTPPFSPASLTPYLPISLLSRYNGRPLFGTRVTTTWCNTKQMKEIGMIPAGDGTDGSPREKPFRHPPRHLGTHSPFGDDSASSGFGGAQVMAGWGSDVQEDPHFSSPRCSGLPARGGRGARGFHRGRGRGQRGARGGRCPPNLPRKHSVGDKGVGDVGASPAKSRSKKRLFMPSYDSPSPPPKRPLKSLFSEKPTDPSSPDSVRSIFDRLGPTAGGAAAPAIVAGEARESLFGEGGSGDEAFRDPPSTPLRTPSPDVGSPAATRREFPSWEQERGRAITRTTRSGSGSSSSSPNRSNWSLAHSTKDDRSPDHPSRSNWSPIHSSKDGWSSDWSPDHSIKAEWSPRESTFPDRSPGLPPQVCSERTLGESPGHQNRANDLLEVTSNKKVVQSPDRPDSPDWSPDCSSRVERLMEHIGKVIEEKKSRKEAEHVTGRSGSSPPDQEGNGAKSGCHGNASLERPEHSTSNVGTSGLGTRPPDEGPLDTPTSRERHLTTLKASIIKVWGVCVCGSARWCVSRWRWWGSVRR